MLLLLLLRLRLILLILLIIFVSNCISFNIKKGLLKLCTTFVGISITVSSSLAIEEYNNILAPIPISTSSFNINKDVVSSFSSSEREIIKIFDDVSPSVVYINTYSKEIDMLNMNILSIPVGEGSGFVWDLDGHIVTNYHVIKDAVSANVIINTPEFKTNQVFKADVTGVDPDKGSNIIIIIIIIIIIMIDIAVLRINVPFAFKSILKPVKVGTSMNLRVGQTTLAIGNPFGLDHTLTTGVISGLGREVKSPNNRPISNVIQTDASINPVNNIIVIIIIIVIHHYQGNSGGPLLDSSGNLIGMNTAIYTMSGTSAGIGFAIPVDTLKYEVTSIIRDGRIIRPSIGFSYLESSRARMLGIKNGVLVLNVPKNSQADKAGLIGTTRSFDGYNLGDIIVGIDDDIISSETDIFKILEKHKVDDQITLKVIRLTDKKGLNDEYPIRNLSIKLIDQINSMNLT